MRAFRLYYYMLLAAGLTFVLSEPMSDTVLLSTDLSSVDAPSSSVPFKTLNLVQKPLVSQASEPEAIPVIEHALDTIDRSKRFNDLYNMMNPNVNIECASCDTQLRSLRYSNPDDPKQCNADNSYLEREISQSSQGSSLISHLINAPIRPNSIIKPSCMRMSMESRFGSTSKSFRECSADGQSARAFRPCITENYFKLINNSFDMVSSCMKDFMTPEADEDNKKLDVRAVYALINVESGFHVNAMSGRGAGGIGQFTEVAIREVNEKELKNIRTSLEGSSDAYCANIAKEHLSSAEPMRPEKSNSCDRISISKGNPLTNMLYTFGYLKGIKKGLNSTLFENKRYKDKFKLSKDDLEKIKRALMVWAHNTGPAGTWTPAKALLNTIYRNKPVTNADEFIHEMQVYLQKFPASANKSSARRKETSHYFPSITKTLNDIEQNVGGGSCVNF